MQVIISPSNMSGVVAMPPSKSMMQRACAASLLHNGTTVITNPGCSDDDKAALNIIKQLGAEVYETVDNTIEIVSRGLMPKADIIHCGESGLSARLFIPIAALSHTDITITGTGSLLHRPMKEYLQALPQLGVSVLETNDRLPMSVRGPMQPGNIEIDGSASSQFLTGLLTAYAFTATEPVHISVNHLASKPYIDLTLQILRLFGKDIVNEDYRKFIVDPQRHKQVDQVRIDIEGDWSAGANFIVAQAMGADVYIKGLSVDSIQADAAVTKVVNGNRPFEFDATHSPDLFPILAVYAGYCQERSQIKGLHRLVHKESNRVESIKAMLLNLGVAYSIVGDTLIVDGGNRFKSCTIDGHNDHRIVMAAAIAALNATGPVTINGAEAVNKSYPAFFEDLLSSGVDCQFVN